MSKDFQVYVVATEKSLAELGSGKIKVESSVLCLNRGPWNSLSECILL